ncbi:MAG TPA: response regulator transcription factor [Bacteroides mediterraneensis]|uniref:response regulator transcription factor n=2 Tax=Bacteroides TaxID=816 RepID=UPI0026187BB8|nr:response regulator transcription factor [Bacteroides mediterraneensis]HJH63393.1 response regulator transcription factor [Bacteroides mediterraneensis]
MIKIFIVDDSEIHLEGMKSILKRSDNLTVAATAQTPNEAKQLLRNEEYDLAILDISLEEETDGLDLARFIKATYPKMPIIILSHYKDIHYIIQSLKMQLNGYLAKDTQAEDLICAIQAVVQGKGFYFGNTISYNDIIKAFGGEENMKKRKPYELTDRELEVIQLLANGYTSKEIANELNIDRNTVETYKDRIKSKLDCKSAIEIVVFAYKNKLIH